MLTCNAADRLSRLLLLKPWRALLIRLHSERCPACRKGLADAAEARSLLVSETEVRPSDDLWRRVNRSLAAEGENSLQKPRAAVFGRPWSWAAATVVVAFLAGYWAFRDFRPEGISGPAQAPAARFEMEYVRVDGLPADAFVYKPQGSDFVMVWAGKAN